MDTELQELLAAAEREQPELVKIAMLASLAARIEAPLLRRLRLELMPDAEPGIEADLWFSDLIYAFDTESCLLRPAIADQLRLRLKASGQLEAVWAIVRDVNRHASPLRKVEETVAYLALRDGDYGEEIVNELRKALKTMKSSQERGVEVARWALYARDRLPSGVKGYAEVAQLEGGMDARITVPGRKPMWSDTPLFDYERDGWIRHSAGATPTVQIGLRLEEMGMAVCDPKSVNPGAVLTIPGSRPKKLQIAVKDRSGRWRYMSMRGREGERIRFESLPVDIEITTEAGEVHGFDRVTTPEPKAVSAPKWPLEEYRPFSEYRYYAYFSYSVPDDDAWDQWVSCFKDELFFSLPSRLRGIKLPPIHLCGDDPLTSGVLHERLEENVRDSFALFLFVHDNYLDSQWCLKELEYFKKHFGEQGFRDRLYVIAMSKGAIEELTSREAWKSLCPSGGQLWVPFYQVAKPNRPIPIYSGDNIPAEGKRRVVSNAFWEQFVGIREDLAKKIRNVTARSKLAAAPAPSENPEIVRIYIESNERQEIYWESLVKQVIHSWDQLIAGEHVEPPLYVRPTGLPMNSIKTLPYLDDADGVVLLWDRKTPDALVAQITTVEGKLRGRTAAPGIIAYLMEPGGRPPAANRVLNWPVLAFEPDANGGLHIADQDGTALVIFLAKVLERKRQRLMAGGSCSEAAK